MKYLLISKTFSETKDKHHIARNHSNENVYERSLTQQKNNGPYPVFHVLVLVKMGDRILFVGKIKGYR